jgi:choline dehydrogenase-like flavoprotein
VHDDRRVIVIGSGPTGAIAARELVDHGLPVTMLESGTEDPAGLLLRARGRTLLRRAPPALSDPDRFVRSGHPGTCWYEHLQPGGLSNQWTGAVPRFAPQDFTDGERLGEQYRWPLDYGDLVPFYDEVEQLLDVSATPEDLDALPQGRIAHPRQLARDWQAIADVARHRGHGLTMVPLADGGDWLLERRGTAFNSFSSIVRPLRASRLFHLLTGAHALRLEWCGRRRMIESVLYHDRRSGTRHRIAAGAVVVACGSLRSTKLLFDSACPDFPEGLGNTEGLLGRHLHDHPREWWTFRSDRPLSRPAPAVYLTRGPYDSSAPLLATSWTLGGTGTRDKVLSLTPLRTRTIGVHVFGSMVPTEDNHVQPSASDRDEFGLPKLDISISFDEETLANVVGARQRLLSLLEEAGYHCTLDPVEPQLVPGVAVHYGGTARMHRSPRHGVLDEWNRPFDIPNLAVVDASCFTTNSEKNPTLTAMALSARAARRLAADLKGG